MCVHHTPFFPGKTPYLHTGNFSFHATHAKTMKTCEENRVFSTSLSNRLCTSCVTKLPNVAVRRACYKLVWPGILAPTRRYRPARRIRIKSCLPWENAD